MDQGEFRCGAGQVTILVNSAPAFAIKDLRTLCGKLFFRKATQLVMIRYLRPPSGMNRVLGL